MGVVFKQKSGATPGCTTSFLQYGQIPFQNKFASNLLNLDNFYPAIIVKLTQGLTVLLYNLLLCHTNSGIYKYR